MTVAPFVYQSHGRLQPLSTQNRGQKIDAMIIIIYDYNCQLLKCGARRLSGVLALAAGRGRDIPGLPFLL